MPGLMRATRHNLVRAAGARATPTRRITPISRKTSPLTGTASGLTLLAPAFTACKMRRSSANAIQRADRRDAIGFLEDGQQQSGGGAIS